MVRADLPPRLTPRLEMSMPRCLVTGGAGFIGSHLATRLVAEGWEVRILDNLSTGSTKNFEHIAEDVDFIEGEIDNR